MITVGTNIVIPSAKQNLTIAAVYDTTGIPSYKTTMSNQDCTNCGRGDTRYSRFGTFQAIDTQDPFLAADNKQRGDTAGLVLEYSFNCDQADWVCSIANQLGLAMLYKTAFNMLEYSVNSGSQFSDQQVINHEGNIERKDGFEFKYGAQIEKVLKGIKFPIGQCFECFKKYSVRNTLPG